jgi:adenylate cyclase
MRPDSIYEIERKFIVSDVPPEVTHAPSVPMRQGYLSIDTDRLLSVRVRSEGEACRLTIKSGQGVKRTEVELPLSRDQFEALWPSTISSLEKTRYRIDYDGFAVEVDVFEGDLAGLVLAEVEFESEESAASFDPPLWVLREVTDDPRYLNQSLSLHGLPS